MLTQEDVINLLVSESEKRMALEERLTKLERANDVVNKGVQIAMEE
jgi:hypothetical protein